MASTTSFDTAIQLLQEIESFIEDELMETNVLADITLTLNATTIHSRDITRVRSQKRNGLLLMKEINKARRVFRDELGPVLDSWAQMSYKPEQMECEGGSDGLCNFSDLSSDGGYATGPEFDLPQLYMSEFYESAAQHLASTAGWWREDGAYSHVNDIRTMSIMRLIRDLKRPIAVHDAMQIDNSEVDGDGSSNWDSDYDTVSTAKFMIRESLSPTLDEW